MLGTIQVNRKGLPREVKSLAGREDLSYEVFYNETSPHISLHSYVVSTKSTGKRNVLILSTMHPYMGVTKDDGKKKPYLYKIYDFCKGGTDIVDQRITVYTVRIKNRRWTVIMICYLLDTSRVNASTIWALNNGKDPRKVDSHTFGWQLAMSLITPLVRRRAQSPSHFSPAVLQKMSIILGETVTANPARVPSTSNQSANESCSTDGTVRKRCVHCVNEIPDSDPNVRLKRRKMSKMKTICQKCKQPSCKAHLIALCPNCQ